MSVLNVALPLGSSVLSLADAEGTIVYWNDAAAASLIRFAR